MYVMYVMPSPSEPSHVPVSEHRGLQERDYVGWRISATLSRGSRCRVHPLGERHGTLITVAVMSVPGSGVAHQPRIRCVLKELPGRTDLM